MAPDGNQLSEDVEGERAIGDLRMRGKGRVRRMVRDQEGKGSGGQGAHLDWLLGMGDEVCSG